jgi:hypothetical protein
MWVMVSASLALTVACSEPTPPGPDHVRAEERPLVARDAAPLRLTVGGAQLTVADAEVVLQAGWGSGASQLGRREEAGRPGPMSLAAGPAGNLYLLDQVNRRVLRYDRDGQLLGQVPIQAETTEDIAVEGADLWALVYEPGLAPGFRVERYAASGEGPTQVTLDRRIQLVTGLFVDGTQIWVEQEHGLQHLVAAQGQALSPGEGKVAPGRPHRGQPGARLGARRAGSHQAQVLRYSPERASLLLEVTTPLPLVQITALETDAAGRVYLGLELGVEAGPELALTQVRELMLVVDGERVSVVDLAVGRVTDTFRPLAVSREGEIYQMQTTEQGVTVRRWTVPQGGGEP